MAARKNQRLDIGPAGRRGSPRRVYLMSAALIALAGLLSTPAAAVPYLDHVILVVMENHAYEQVTPFPYTASLMAAGSTCTNSHAVTHPSQPNYIALWSGGLQGISDNTSCPAPGYPLMVENLGHACEDAGVTWRSYSESLPAAGSTICTAGSGTNIYVRKHAPWTQFGNASRSNERPFSDLAADIAAGTLPRFAFVLPDQCHNTHDCSLGTGDAWLSQNMPGLIAAAGPNGMVVLTWDEDNGAYGNHILTLFVGPPVKVNYQNTRAVTHYTVLRTICDALGLEPIGWAAFEVPLSDVFVGTSGGGSDPSVPPLGLGAPTPNPSRGDVTASLTLVDELAVRAAIYDIQGRTVRTLLAGPARGQLALVWDGSDDSGRLAPPGLYLLRVRSGLGTFQQKILRVGR